MTPEQLEAIRERDAWYGPEIPLADRGSVSDRRWLLRHIEQLEKRLADTIDDHDRVVRTDAHLLAHQQARGIEAREEEAQGIEDYLDLRDHADAQSVRAQSAEAERDTLRAELARKDAEIGRLEKLLKEAVGIAKAYADDDEHTYEPCGDETGNFAPECRPCRALQVAALGEEVTP